MSNALNDSESAASFDRIEEFLKKSGWSYERLDSGEATDGSFILETSEPDCLVELFLDGRLAFQFGVDMEEMRSLLTGDQTEDMADDELVRVARYHLKPIVDRYRLPLVREGLEETVDATPDYYSITFEKHLDLSDPMRAMHEVARCLMILEKTSA